METAPLKSFATASRTELIREVGARITAVLAQGSPERVEQPNAVAALERAISGAGGGDKGKKHVADKVAYTWFNRLIALRFMDANGYTGIGVVSPATDQVGQPEVLAAAKRGQLDASVVKGANAATIAGLLNGTRMPRPGVDAQAEAYALLLADYCRFWHGAMPFMFEREGDYTELLIPANLLAQESVLSRSVSVLTEDVCRDVEVIGWLYQFYIAERKDEVFAGFKKNRKAGADEIPAATQLFTPHWIVRYLVENSLGRLWMLNHPESRLVDQMDYYIAPVDEETDFLRISKPEELKVIDPACGSGHMLTYAFDLLYAIYEEEGYAPSKIPALILTNNLYGTEIDPRAGALAAFALTMKAAAKRKLFLKNPVEPNVCVIDPISFSTDELSYLATGHGDRHAEEAFWNQFSQADTVGSLITPDPALTARLERHLETVSDGGDMYKADALDWARQAIRQAEYLLPRYSVALANPPYMGGRNMGPELSAFARDLYPDSKADLFSMFIDRNLRLVTAHGYVAMVTMQSWMFLSAYKRMRQSILDEHSISSMVHLGTGAFDSIGGEVVSTTAFVVASQTRGLSGQYVDLRAGRNEAQKQDVLQSALKGGALHCVTTEELKEVEGAPIAYWLGEELRRSFATLPPMSSRLKPAVGLNTGDNDRFLRLWHEVAINDVSFHSRSLTEARESGKKWFPYNKGGGHRKWYGNHFYLINWKDDGRELKEYATIRNGGRHWSRYIQNLDAMLKECITWSDITTQSFAARYSPAGFLFDVKGSSGIPKNVRELGGLLALMCSPLMPAFMKALNPTVTFQVGDLARVPVALTSDPIETGIADLLPVKVAMQDWDIYETSWNFNGSPLIVEHIPGAKLADALGDLHAHWEVKTLELQSWEIASCTDLSERYGVPAPSAVSIEEVTLTSNPHYRFARVEDVAERMRLRVRADVADLVSYAVGCMFGRYSLDEPGLILANQSATLQDYLATVPSPRFTPDADNVIPIVDGDWFEDDVVGLFRQFLRTAFGEQHFEENLNFVTESLGVRNLRDYFISRAGRSKFYDDHVQRYKKRPIYWLFSSPKGSFNALIYMHRYTPSTVSAVLTYLREYVTKLESAVQQAERAGNAKEADRLRKILVELNEYEHDTLYPKASENVVIDLDDGVKANYPRFGAALRKITGLEASGD
ncbi:MAG TPA: BREX-1 system adenine-specific DNA-methyltransferase PglX [Candidatus Nanopelagicales bacterium]|nr:BREX-1 system adenine-specific DNA-methyltransferase PglX [Candidatus Nanopelagicales bacterium]